MTMNDTTQRPRQRPEPTMALAAMTLTAMSLALVVGLSGCGRQVPDPVPAPAPVPVPTALTAGFAALTQDAHPTEGGACNLDLAAGAPDTGAGFAISTADARPYQGWAVLSVDDEQDGAQVRLLLASEDGKRFAAPLQRGERPDVAQHFKRPSLHAAGFAATLSAGDVPAGVYRMSVLIGPPDRAVACGAWRATVQ